MKAFFNLQINYIEDEMNENFAVNQHFLRRQIFWCGYIIKIVFP